LGYDSNKFESESESDFNNMSESMKAQWYSGSFEVFFGLLCSHFTKIPVNVT